VSSEPTVQRELPFDTARLIQKAIEELDGSLSSSLVSLGPPRYRVEMRLGGIGGDQAAELQAIAERFNVELRFTPDPDVHPSRGLCIRFTRPGSWYARGEHHREARS
jgi:hypothetical protein